jgi:predicted nucleic acid-binding protein
LKKDSNKTRILLDTKPLIKFFAKEDGWEIVQKILTRIEDGQIEAAISVVTLTEIYYKYIHEKKPELAQTRVTELKYAIYLKKIEINEEIAIQAGEFKGKYQVPIADAFIAASAHSIGATVISDDADFKKITDIKTQTEKEFHTTMT